MRKKEIQNMTSAVLLLASVVKELSEKVDNCNGFCECILDEVTPMGMALDKLVEAAPMTMD